MKKVSGLGIVVVAGGSSKRFGSSNKLLQELDGIPVFIHCLKTFLPLAEYGKIILVVPDQERMTFQELIDKHLPDSGILLTVGGSCRTESVVRGLNTLPSDTDTVAIHDAARPLIRGGVLLELVRVVKENKCGAIAAEKMIDSVCRTTENGEITENLPREQLWRIQTPQVFSYRDICSAYAQLGSIELTDDSAAARLCGIPVRVVENPYPNIKLTTPSDLSLIKHLKNIEKQ